MEKPATKKAEDTWVIQNSDDLRRLVIRQKTIVITGLMNKGFIRRNTNYRTDNNNTLAKQC
jgi:hypothetical protein